MAKAWKGMDPLAGLDDDEDEDDQDEEEDEEGSEGDEGDGENGAGEKAQSASEQKKPGVAIDYASLNRHGYQGGGSVLYVPEAPQDTDADYSKWGRGGGGGGQQRRTPDGKAEEELLDSREEREKLRERTSGDAVQRSAAAALAYAEAERQRRRDIAEERKAMSFSQREKRKRDAGQASRGKNYVEEEKRQLRGSGVYSGFDS